MNAKRSYALSIANASSRAYIADFPVNESGTLP